MRLADIEAGIVIAAVWAAAAHFTASADSMFLMTFFLTAFFLFAAGSLLRGGGAVLMTAFTMGALSILTASVGGPGAYKLVLFSVAGLVFEALRSKDGYRQLEGSLAAVITMPFSMWVMSGAQAALLSNVADLMLLALLSGLAGVGLALLAWGRAEHTEAVIKFQCAATARTGRELQRLMKHRKRF